MTLRLASLDYALPECDTTLRVFPFIVGSAADAHLRLDDHSVSGHHCSFHEVDGRFMVRDLGSLHGTFLNGERITQAEVRLGDELSIGMLTFLVQSAPAVELPSDEVPVEAT